GAFDAVGSILVVALMIAPPAAAYLLTDVLSRMIVISAFIGIISAVSGYWLAHAFDVNIAGSMATTAGLIFVLVFLLAPERGLLAVFRRRARQRWEFAQKVLAIHLFNHEDTPEAAYECRIEHLHEHLRWEPDFATQVVRRSRGQGILIFQNGHLVLTELGRKLAQKALIMSTDKC
ncbi:MAG: metal ABC transporter permease, partial [Deltaproteobacteria bacterium]|nr:metal ABC transporter permease [Deltaproteobacteria bacterium]